MMISILRLEAPMMSFGAPIVSEQGFIQPYPTLSMMTGLLANALGYDRRQAKKHERLQRAISYAVREDVTGEKVVDYQTVDLGSPYLLAYGSKKDSVAWTTWGHLDQRSGSNSSRGTAQRNREYWADAKYTIALYIDGLSAEEIEKALSRPERPLFIGRKPCLPAVRIFHSAVEAPSPRKALYMSSTLPTDDEGNEVVPTRIWYESEEGTPVTDSRDWANQIHVGERGIVEAPY